jgi:hypothetical protein
LVDDEVEGVEVDDDEDFVVEEPDVLEEESAELLSPLSLPALLELESLSPEEEEEDDELVRPLAEADDARESVMYQPLPLKTMPTGWITLRSAPPHCSQVVRGGSEKLWRFSMRSLQAVQV